MARCLVLVAILCKVVTATSSLASLCKSEYALSVSGAKKIDGDWKTNFSIENWNATNNWTLIVEHKMTEDEGKTASYIKGFLTDLNISTDGMKQLWTCENDISIIESNTKIKDDFGVIPYPKWNITEDVQYKNLRYWQTTSYDCSSLSGCRSKLREIYSQHMKSDGRLLDNFHILPDGSIIEGAGWDSLYENAVRINIISKAKDVNPSNLALEAFAYLAQVVVSLGKAVRGPQILVPPHTSGSVDSEVRRWSNSYRLGFDEDLSLAKISLDGDLRVVSRSEWNGIRRLRELERSKGQADIVEVNIKTSDCFSLNSCAKFVRNMQLAHLRIHSDIFPNFIFAGDGNIYEGLGWNWSRKDNAVYFDILVDAKSNVPWLHVLTAFTLQLREGVDLGWISESYKINVVSTANKETTAKVIKWGEWARHIVKENVTVNLQITGGSDSIITRIDTGNTVRQKNVVVQSHPIEKIHFTQTNALCSKRIDCLPFYRSLGSKSLKSLKDIKSNFYFVDDNEDYGVVHEGLGWDLTTKENEVVFEFLTENANTLPSNRSMLASSFIIREGVKRGILRADYQLSVGKHTTIEFENQVRFWDKRIREI